MRHDVIAMTTCSDMCRVRGNLAPDQKGQAAEQMAAREDRQEVSGLSEARHEDRAYGSADPREDLDPEDPKMSSSNARACGSIPHESGTFLVI
ncbi:hypothetical protein JOB18_046967 [Solea senegalensis]|uniref:Uncharacterized protein n=1 Tax=Solea senegalensis TaxID=28829 RepID=A0AAV6RHW6_SOLSE|nr:hypothetical protein JOB18_046967 [Solea senegalensis]